MLNPSINENPTSTSPSDCVFKNKLKSTYNRKLNWTHTQTHNGEHVRASSQFRNNDILIQGQYGH